MKAAELAEVMRQITAVNAALVVATAQYACAAVHGERGDAEKSDANLKLAKSTAEQAIWLLQKMVE